MQDQVQLTLNGQALLIGDFNAVAHEAAHADDMALAEILRMAPYDGSTVTRGIMPFGYRGAANNLGIILGTAGGVHVGQFRAVVGSRTTLATSPADNYMDIRSAVFTAVSGQTLAVPVGAGQARVHLVYATLYVDRNASTTVRRIKDVTSAVVTSTNVVPTLQSYITVALVSVNSGSIPTIPADPTGGYNIPIAYLRTAAGYTSGSFLAAADVVDASTVVSPFRHQVAPANKIWMNTGAFLQSATPPGAGTFTNWSTFTDGRPRTYMPAEMNGTVTRFIPILISVDAGAVVDIADGSIVDDSIDWRNRVFKCVGQLAGTASFKDFAWHADGLPRVVNATAPVPVTLTQLGNSLTANPDFGSRLTVFSATNANSPAFVGVGGTIELYVDASTGALKVKRVEGGALTSYTLFVWLEASHPFTNK